MIWGHIIVTIFKDGTAEIDFINKNQSLQFLSNEARQELQLALHRTIE